MLLVAIFPFFALCAFVHPSADDYSMVWLVKSSSFWQYQKDMYLGWTGRYAANFLEALHPMRFGSLWLYRLIPAVLMILLYCSIVFLLNSITGKVFRKFTRHLIALSFFALYLNIFPSTAESVYWLPGGIEYLLAGILSIFVIALLVRSGNRNDAHRWLKLIPASLAVLVVGGLNEISLALLAAILFFALLYIRIRQKRNDFNIFMIFVLLVVAGTIDISAPGNFIRMSVFSDPLDISASLLLSVKGVVKVTGIHFQSPAFVLMSVLFISGAGEILRKPDISKWIPEVHPLLSFSLSALLIFGLYLPGALGMGIDPPMRVHAAISLAFLLLWFLNLAILLQYLDAKGMQVAVVPVFVIKLLIIAAFMLTFLDFTKVPNGPFIARGNVPAAFHDLFFKAGDYDRQLQQRYVEIRQRKFSGDKMITVKKLQNIPRTIYFIDIDTSASDWKNTDYAKYFDVDSIRISEELKN